MMLFTKQKIQIAILYSSTLTGILFGLLASIVNTRFLPPTDYGDVRYIQNIINFISSFLIFGYFLSGARLMALSNDRSYTRRVKGALIIILTIACFILCMAMPICYCIHKENTTLATLFLVSMP